jgi:uncharacterized repeat protein (TIGR03837 family)
MRYDVFCKVVDNFGDAAVCWRLARQLAQEQGAQVRLYLDQLQALALLRPEISSNRESQHLEGVEIRRWSGATPFDATADVVIEGFGCGLPEVQVAAMSKKNPAPVWIILEYLSGESWVEEHHGLPSPHPRLPLNRHYFFPGFTSRTGGLLREADLTERRNGFLNSPDRKNAFWRDLGCAAPRTDEEVCIISLFGYDNINVLPLLEAWAQGKTRTFAVVPPGRLRTHVGGFFGARSAGDGDTFSLGALTVRNIPFLPQARYDELLWACDWNFVRGEDSFVRAQWASRPFLWQAYPQSGNTHHKKVEAFLSLYCAGLSEDVESRLKRIFAAWNGAGQMRPEYWHELQASHRELEQHALQWWQYLSEIPDLATNLAHFCLERLK